MFGLAHASGSTASLLLNLEAVLTAMIAWVMFRENAGRRVVLGMFAIIAGGMVLSWPVGEVGMDDSLGPVAIVAACACWSIDNKRYNQIMSRSHRRLVAWLSIGFLLFAQAAVAGYLCPGETQGSLAMRSMTTSRAAKPCHGMDQVNLNLCKQHCEQSAQSVDSRVQAKIDLPALPAMALAYPFYSQTPQIQCLPQNVWLRVTKPPLYLHHCRFLI